MAVPSGHAYVENVGVRRQNCTLVLDGERVDAPPIVRDVVKARLVAKSNGTPCKVRQLELSAEVLRRKYEGEAVFGDRLRGRVDERIEGSQVEPPVRCRYL